MEQKDLKNQKDLQGGIQYDGNLARQIQPQVQPEPSRVVRRKKVIRKKDVGVFKLRVHLLGTMLYIFGLGIAYIMGSSALSSKRSDLKSLQAEYNTLKGANEILSSELVIDTDLNTLYTTAVEQFGMKEPSSKQVHYITLSETSFVEGIARQNVNQEKRFKMQFGE